MRTWLAILLVLLPALAWAQDPIPAARKTDWSYAGVYGGIPTYSQTCTTFNSTTGTAAAVNAAIVSCGATYPNGSVIVLSAGIYTWDAVVTLATSKVVLRGAGADQTIIRHGATNNALLYMGGGDASDTFPATTITGGGAKDSFSFTVNTTAALAVNQIIELQRNKPSYIFSREYPTDPFSVQVNKITAINGLTVTVQNPLHRDYTAANSAFIWHTWSAKTEGSGVEDVKLDHSTYTGGSGTLVSVLRCYNSWIKGVEIYKGFNWAIVLGAALNFEIRDSFIHESQSYGSNNAGVDLQTNGGYGNISNIKVENNIFDRLFPAVELFGVTSGNVIGYNYISRPQTAADSISVTWSIMIHAPHVMLNLYEGNITPMIGQDGYTGGASHETIFRNLITGATPGLRGPAIPIEYGSAIWLKRLSYYFNVVGNVIGCTEQMSPSYTHFYETPAAGTTACGGWCANPYELGFPNLGNLGLDPYDAWYPNGITAYPDPNVASTLFRWGNYDFFNAAIRWEASEVPSGVDVPGNHTLRSSYYLTSKPAWFGSVAFPPIGPDVTATTHGGVGTSDASGHANKIPAQLCWESRNLLTGGTFNATACYYSGAAAPNAPTNVRIR